MNGGLIKAEIVWNLIKLNSVVLFTNVYDMATEIYLPVQNLSQEFIVLAFKWPTFVKNITTSKLQKATSIPQLSIGYHCSL